MMVFMALFHLYNDLKDSLQTKIDLEAFEVSFFFFLEILQILIFFTSIKKKYVDIYLKLWLGGQTYGHIKRNKRIKNLFGIFISLTNHQLIWIKLSY